MSPTFPVFGHGESMRAGQKLRVDVRSSRITSLIGVFDMFSASLAAQHYGGMFISGFGFAASYYGLPDIGFIAWPDMVNFVARLRLAFPHQHLLVDIDDGYVDPEVACHVVEHLERIGASVMILEDQKRPCRCGHVDGKQILPLREYLDKLNLVLQTRADVLVVARTDATEESEILRRAEALAATDADVLLVDGVRGVDWIRKVCGVIGDKPLLFNQIAGGKSPRLSLTELEDLGVNVAIYSTPCLFAAQTAIENALLELRANDGRLPEVKEGDVGIAACTELLERNISRHHTRRGKPLRSDLNDRRGSGQMSRISILSRLRIDPYIVALLATVAVASLLPARGVMATGFNDATTIAIGLLFFLYGARLSSKEALDGLKHWRLHSFVLASTFLLFPLLGLAAKLLVPGVLTPELYVGLLFLCCLPSTVQSSIAFTSIARGNVAAAICSASLSNLIGIVLTPLLVALLLFTGSSGDEVSLDSVRDIMVQLLVPFTAGQLVRCWISGFITTHKKALSYVDRGSILLVVYVAFSKGVVAGIWGRMTPVSLMLLLIVNIVLLTIVMVATTVTARKLGFSREDEIAIVFCGSKKSLASGVPIATVLFSAATVGLTVLPLMLFHQTQLMACAWLARRYAARPVATHLAEEPITRPKPEIALVAGSATELERA